MDRSKNQRNVEGRFRTFKLVSPYLVVGTLLAAILPGPWTSLRSAPNSVQSGIKIAGGASGDGGDASHFQYLEWKRRTNGFEYRVGIESRHAPMHTIPGAHARGEPKHARISLSLQGEYWKLMAGNRFLPGPRTRFLSHSVFYSAFADIPDPRETETLFLRPGPAWFGRGDFPLPGIFAPADTGKPGLFAADDAGTILAAWHFSSRRGVLALDRKWTAGIYRGRIRGDIIANGRTTEGNLFLDAAPAAGSKPAANSEPGSGSKPGANSKPMDDSIPGRDFTFAPRIVSEWERRGYRDDFRRDYHQANTAERKGKSGLGSVRLEWPKLIMLEAAGEDRGLTGMRLAGAQIRPGTDTLGRIILRGRAYRRRDYGSDAEGRTIAPREDAGGGLGYTLRRRHAGFRILYEERRRGKPSGELAFWIRGRGLEFTMEAIFGPPRRDFLFLRTRRERGTGARFYPDRAGALVLRVRSESFYFYLSSTATVDKPEYYANMQVKLEL